MTMRMIYVTVPIGLALAAGGAHLLLNRSDGPNPELFQAVQKREMHPVTPQMSEAAAARSKTAAGRYERTDHRDRPVVIAEGSGTPQMVIFIKEGCPCSVDAEPLFNRLAKKFEGKVDFIGVIDGDEKVARQWVLDNNVRYPVVPDPDATIMKAYGAKQSVYCALVDSKGKIVKMYPGYWADMLKDANAKLSAMAKVPETPFDPQYAPKEPTSGCYFALK